MFKLRHCLKQVSSLFRRVFSDYLSPFLARLKSLRIAGVTMPESRPPVPTSAVLHHQPTSRDVAPENIHDRPEKAPQLDSQEKAAALQDPPQNQVQELPQVRQPQPVPTGELPGPPDRARAFGQSQEVEVPPVAFVGEADDRHASSTGAGGCTGDNYYCKMTAPVPAQPATTTFEVFCEVAPVDVWAHIFACLPVTDVVRAREYFRGGGGGGKTEKGGGTSTGSGSSFASMIDANDLLWQKQFENLATPYPSGGAEEKTETRGQEDAKLLAMLSAPLDAELKLCSSNFFATFRRLHYVMQRWLGFDRADFARPDISSPPRPPPGNTIAAGPFTLSSLLLAARFRRALPKALRVTLSGSGGRWCCKSLPLATLPDDEDCIKMPPRPAKVKPPEVRKPDALPKASGIIKKRGSKQHVDRQEISPDPNRREIPPDDIIRPNKEERQMAWTKFLQQVWTDSFPGGEIFAADGVEDAEMIMNGPAESPRLKESVLDFWHAALKNNTGHMIPPLRPNKYGDDSLKQIRDFALLLGVQGYCGEHLRYVQETLLRDYESQQQADAPPKSGENPLRYPLARERFAPHRLHIAVLKRRLEREARMEAKYRYACAAAEAGEQEQEDPRESAFQDFWEEKAIVAEAAQLDIYLKPPEEVDEDLQRQRGGLPRGKAPVGLMLQRLLTQAAHMSMPPWQGHKGLFGAFNVYNTNYSGQFMFPRVSFRSDDEGQQGDDQTGCYARFLGGRGIEGGARRILLRKAEDVLPASTGGVDGVGDVRRSGLAPLAVMHNPVLLGRGFSQQRARTTTHADHDRGDAELTELLLQPTGENVFHWVHEYCRRLETGVYAYKPNPGTDASSPYLSRALSLFPEANLGGGSRSGGSPTIFGSHTCASSGIRIEGSGLFLGNNVGFAYSLRFSLDRSGSAAPPEHSSYQLHSRHIDIQYYDEEDEEYRSVRPTPTTGPAVVGYHPLLTDGGHVICATSDPHGHWTREHSTFDPELMKKEEEDEEDGVMCADVGAVAGDEKKNTGNKIKVKKYTIALEKDPVKHFDSFLRKREKFFEKDLVAAAGKPPGASGVLGASGSSSSSASTTSASFAPPPRTNAPYWTDAAATERVRKLLRELAASANEGGMPLFVEGQFSYQSQTGPLPNNKGRFVGKMLFVPGTIEHPAGDAFWVDVPVFHFEKKPGGYAFF